MKPVKSGMGWVISAGKCPGLSVDGAQVSTHSRPPGSPQKSDERGAGEGKDSAYPDGGSELLHFLAKQHRLIFWVGRGGIVILRAEACREGYHHWAW